MTQKGRLTDTGSVTFEDVVLMEEWLWQGMMVYVGLEYGKAKWQLNVGQLVNWSKSVSFERWTAMTMIGMEMVRHW